jgi:hypothetical protein
MFYLIQGRPTQTHVSEPHLSFFFLKLLWSFYVQNWEKMVKISIFLIDIDISLNSESTFSQKMFLCRSLDAPEFNTIYKKILIQHFQKHH